MNRNKIYDEMKSGKEIIEKAKPELKRLDKVCDALEKLKNGYLTPEQTQEFIEGRKKLNLFGKGK